MLFNIIFIFLYFCTCESKRYDGYALLRGIPGSEEHLQFFKNVTKDYDVNVWQPPGIVNVPVDFTISPQHIDIVRSEAERRNIHLETLNTDIQSAFDNQSVNSYSRRDMTSFNWKSYYRVNDIYAWMTDLSNKYPEEISVFDIGRTIENRPIKALNIVFKGSKRRSAVIVEGGIHAREWAAQAVVTYLINELISARRSNKKNELSGIAFNYEWYFIPVLNVDGYEYSHTTDRMWRKNRRGGYGVDVNRNFDAAFGSKDFMVKGRDKYTPIVTKICTQQLYCHTVGVTRTDKESEEYCGPQAFSEPESIHMKNFVHSVNLKLPVSHYVGFHSYGQLFIIPYAFTKKHHQNFNEMKKIGDTAAKRIRKRYGTKYTVGTAFDTVGYLASGVSACWAKKTYSIPYVGVFELRDEGKYGFALPSRLILDMCRETMDGLLEVLKPRAKTKLGGQSPNGQSRIVFNELVIALIIFLALIFGS